MKQLFSTLALLLVAHVGLLAQTQMHVTLKDGTTHDFAVADVKQITFDDKTTPPAEAKHQAVDLGLPSGVKWATCNIGASKPEDHGDYFAWGETEPNRKNHVDKYNSWAIYKWCKGTETSMSKYCAQSAYGKKDGKTTLEASDDAATQLWGKSWRMPTRDDITELIKKCKWTKTKLNGVKGFEVKGPNGKTIFLPMAGLFSDEDDYSIVHEGTDAYYYTSSLGQKYSNEACYLYFEYEEGATSGGVEEDWRFFQYSIRPVTK